jgi:hypothetical protein
MMAGTQISPVCEVILKWEPIEICGLPTVAGYPAMGGGWMALCEGHVSPHSKYVYPVADIESGIAQHMAEHGSRG